MTATDRITGISTSVAMKAPCRVATTANITLSGLQTVDGVTVAADDRVLVKNQTTAAENGIYYASSGNWQRTPDFDGARDVVSGTLVRVNSGTTYANTYWSVSTAGTITIGTTSISFSRDETFGTGALYLPSSNLALNGGMQIDQANEGTAVSITTGTYYYGADGWCGSDVLNDASSVTVQRVTDAPTGLTHSVKLTAGAAASSVQAGSRFRIHSNIGYEDARTLRYGTSAALTTSLSFWVKSSKAGTFAVALANTDGSRCLFYMYDVAAANTWQYVTIDAMPGCTDGTWTTSYSTIWGYWVFAVICGSTFQGSPSQEGAWQSVHVGSDNTITNNGFLTSGYTFQITGVMWTATPVAVPYREAPDELRRCQKRYEKSYEQGTKPGTASTIAGSTNLYVKGTVTGGALSTCLRVDKVKTPTATFYSPETGASGKVRDYTAGADLNAGSFPNVSKTAVTGGVLSGATADLNIAWHWVADARL